MLDIEAIKAREQAATKGPWKFDANGDWSISAPTSGGYSAIIVCGMLGENESSFEDTYPISTWKDGEFIAHAREDIPALIAEIERLRDEADKLVEIIEKHADEVERLQGIINTALSLRGTPNAWAEVERLQQRLLTAAGDDLCRLTQEEIKAMSSGGVPIPPKEEFLASCERFHAQVAGESGVNQNCLTLAQLIAENERLSKQVRILQHERDQCVSNHVALDSHAEKLEAEVERLQGIINTALSLSKPNG